MLFLSVLFLFVLYMLFLFVLFVLFLFVLFLFHDQIVKSISFKYKKAVSKGINSGL